MPTTGAAIDIGAAWINDTNQERMWGLVGEFGLGVVEQNTEGRVVLLDAGRGRREFGYGETASVSYPFSRGKGGGRGRWWLLTCELSGCM